MREKIIGCSCYSCKRGRKEALRRMHRKIRRNTKQILKLGNEIIEIVHSTWYTD